MNPTPVLVQPDLLIGPTMAAFWGLIPVLLFAIVLICICDNLLDLIAASIRRLRLVRRR